MPVLSNAKIAWRNGNVPMATEYADIYFSPEDGRAETAHVFLSGVDFDGLMARGSDIVIGETGFGTGLNFLVTANEWLDKAHPGAHLHYVSVEGIPLTRSDMATALQAFPDLSPLAGELIEKFPPPLSGTYQIKFEGRPISLTLLLGDVAQCLQDYDARVDAWFLDGFAPQKNPQMWSPDVFAEIARLSAEGAKVATFTVAGAVRRGLQEAGFETERRPGFGGKRECLRATFLSRRTRKKIDPWYRRPAAHARKSEVAVIGAGIAGLSLAAQLQREGVSVQVYDRASGVAQGASGNPCGMINPRMSLGGDAAAAFRSSAFMRAVQYYDDLERTTSSTTSMRGILQLAVDEKTRARHERWLQSELLPDGWLERIDAEGVSKILGLPAECGALLSQQARFFSPVDICSSLAANLSLRLKTSVEHLVHSRRGWELIDRDNRAIGQADVVVLANATGVSSFAQASDLPLRKSRGQITIVPASPQSRKLPYGLSFGGYLSPAFDLEGHGAVHVLGATKDWVEASGKREGEEIRPSDHAENLAKLSRHMDLGFGQLDVKNLPGRVAYRAATPDKLPMVGPAPVIESYRRAYSTLHHGRHYEVLPDADYHDGLFVFSGLGARGFQWAPLCADILTAQILGHSLPVSKSITEALHPGRFVIRDLKRAG